MAKKTDAEQQEVFEDIEGAELLIPISELTGSMQLRLLSRARTLGLDTTGDDAGIDLDSIADLIDFVADRYATSKPSFDKFTSGEGGFQRAINLVMAYIGEVGKGVA